MPKVGLRESFELQTRDKYTKVQCEIGVTCDGRELPNMSVIGGALEEAIALFQTRITESYQVVPARKEFETVSQPAVANATPVVPVIPEPEPVPAVQPAKPVPFG